MTALQLTMLLNIGSIVAGLGAWALAFLAIYTKKPKSAHNLSVASFSVCTISLILQFFEIANRVNRDDFAAIEDTIRAVIIAAVVLVAVTVALNIVSLRKAKEVR